MEIAMLNSEPILSEFFTKEELTDPSIRPSRLLRRVEAAQYVRDKWGYPCAPGTLAKYAVVGGGPRFRKAGRYPLYHPDDLDGWLKGKLSNLASSTSALALGIATPTRTTEERKSI
jgi:hypothetical protein